MLKYTKTRQIYLFKGIFPTDVRSGRRCLGYLEFVKIRLEDLDFRMILRFEDENKYFKIFISIEGLMYFCNEKHLKHTSENQNLQ